MVQSLTVLLHHRTILGVEANQSGKGGEPDAATDVELPLAVAHDLEVVDVSLVVEEGQHQGILLAGALSDEVGPRAGSLQTLAGEHSTQGAMVPPVKVGEGRPGQGGGGRRM